MPQPIRAAFGSAAGEPDEDHVSRGSSQDNGAAGGRMDDFEETRLLNDPRYRQLGDLLGEAQGLTSEQIDEILAYQKENGVRFGVAAIRLGHSTERDVLFALARQYHYPYALEGSENYNPELVVGTDPFGEQAETFRELRSQLLQGAMEAGADGRRPALAVISPNTGDGKTFFAANLAIAFSQLGGRTVLIDADMRTPRQHDIFGVDPQTGLSSVLAGRTKERVIHRIPAIPSLYVMPVGAIPPNPLELVQGMPFSLLVREMTQKFDHVIIDTPAASHGSDCRVVAMKCGAAIAIGREGKTRMPELQALVTKLGKRSTKLAGIVINQW
jgi:chain length determinant protein tyrosine kinase EpsG